MLFVKYFMIYNILSSILTMNQQEKKQDIKNVVSLEEQLKQLAMLQRKSISRLQIISFDNFVSIKSLNDEYSFLRIIIFSLLSKIAQNESPANQEKLTKLKNIINQLECREFVENKGIKRQLLVEVGLFGLKQLFETHYERNENSPVQQYQNQLIRLFNSIPFFDEILMRALKEDIDSKLGKSQSTIRDEQVSQIQETLKQYIFQEFNIKIIVFKKNQLQHINRKKFLACMCQKSDEIRLISENIVSRATNRDSDNNYYPSDYLRLTSRQFQKMKFCSPAALFGSKKFSNEKVKCFSIDSSEEKPKYQFNHTNFADKGSKLAYSLTSTFNDKVPANLEDRVSQTPEQPKSTMQNTVSDYLLQTIEDSVTASLDLGSPSFHRKNKLYMKQNYNQDNILQGNLKRFDCSEERKNSDVIPFEFPSQENLQAMINKYDPDKKNKIIRRKTKTKSKGGGLWNFLCCNHD